MLRKLQLMLAKNRLRLEYQKLIAINQEYSSVGCGASLLGIVSGSAATQANRVVNAMEAVRKLDAECPPTPTWIINMAGG